MRNRTEPTIDWKDRQRKKSGQNNELEQELTEALHVSISNLGRRYDAILEREKKKAQTDQHA
ncbi:MAG: hypothetical protein ABSC92_02480 [Rhizomicrobium sp.]|jgi:hypothetical protein